jgi:hypothetical protein
LVKRSSLTLHSIEVGGSERWVAVRRDIAVPLVIGQNNNDVRRASDGGLSDGGLQEKQSEQESPCIQQESYRLAIEDEHREDFASRR